jgi:hypothetical protein
MRPIIVFCVNRVLGPIGGKGSTNCLRGDCRSIGICMPMYRSDFAQTLGAAAKNATVTLLNFWPRIKTKQSEKIRDKSGISKA